jgi:nucleoside-diphosphate kinase
MPGMERTLILLKPDCVQRRLMGRVISRLEDKGLNILAMKTLIFANQRSLGRISED